MSTKKTAAKPVAKTAAAKKPAVRKPVQKAPAKTATAKAPAKPKGPALRVVEKVEPPVPIAPAAPQETPPEQPPQGGALSAEALANLERLGNDAALKDKPPVEGELEPTPEELAAQQKQSEGAAVMGAMGGLMAVEGIDRGVKFFYPYVEIPGATKAKLAVSFADVISKYMQGGADMPEWFTRYVLPYMQELKLMGQLGMLIGSVVFQVKAEERRLEEEARAAALKQPGQGPQGGPDFSTVPAGG